ncbi:hypothetical protein ACEQPO_01730 [Bacillus sp. SL00103]
MLCLSQLWTILFAQLIKGISKEALDQGYKAIVLQTFYQESLELEGLQLLKEEK